MIADEDIRDMEALKNGDKEAFNGILARHEVRILNYIHRFTMDSRDAEDIAQEVFLRVYRSAGGYVPTARFSTWLYRIASNLSLDYLKKRKRNALWNARTVDGGAASEEGGNFELRDISAKTPEASVEDEAERKRVASALSELPDNQRLALALKVYENRPYEEISEIMGCSMSSVESLIFRARQNLKKTLKGGDGK